MITIAKTASVPVPLWLHEVMAIIRQRVPPHQFKMMFESLMTAVSKTRGMPIKKWNRIHDLWLADLTDACLERATLANKPAAYCTEIVRACRMVSAALRSGDRAHFTEAFGQAVAAAAVAVKEVGAAHTAADAAAALDVADAAITAVSAAAATAPLLSVAVNATSGSFMRAAQLAELRWSRSALDAANAAAGRSGSSKIYDDLHRKLLINIEDAARQ